MKDFIRHISRSEIYYLVEANSEFFFYIPRWLLRYIPNPKGKSSTTLKIDQEINDQHCWYPNTPVIMVSDGYCLTMFLNSVSNVLSHADIYISHVLTCMQFSVLVTLSAELSVFCQKSYSEMTALSTDTIQEIRKIKGFQVVLAKLVIAEQQWTSGW